MSRPPQRNVNPTTMSHGNTSTSGLSNATYSNKHHAYTFLGTDALSLSSRSRDIPSVDGMPPSNDGSDLRVPVAANVSHCSSSHRESILSQDASTSKNESDSAAPVTAYVSHCSRSYRDPIPSQIGFYMGHWVHILVSAKALHVFQHDIHTRIPFPEHNNENLKFAHECIVESIVEYMEDNRGVQIDTGKLLFRLS